jgi:hypothetical protein
MFRLNVVALVMFVIAALLGVAISRGLFAGNTAISGGISGVAMLLMDLCYRGRQKPSDNRTHLSPRERWWSVERGGFIAIMPSWLMGVTLTAMALTHPYWHVPR